MPQLLEPQLATLLDAPPTGNDWLFEIKLDGYRVLARINEGKVRLFTRNGQDWTERMPHIAAALHELPVQQAWLDGEVAVSDAEGRTDFKLLQRCLAGQGGQMVYHLFDVLYLDGESLTDTPLEERKARLAELLQRAPAQDVLRLNAHIEADARDAFEQACMHGMEGLIGKRRHATYTAGRSRTWVKLKCRERQEFVIGGYIRPNGDAEPEALLAGVYGADGRLHYVGKVAVAPGEQSLAGIVQRARTSSPFLRPPRGADVRRAQWVEPTQVMEASFTGWTADGLIRHAMFIALRTDKPPTAVRRETAVSASSLEASAQSGAVVAGVSISHAGRVIFPSLGITKGDLARYYESIGERLLPHIVNRPLALVRCPGGAEAQCFFQKHLHDPLPADLQAVEEPAGAGTGGSYVIANSVAAVIRLVQINVLELHTWNASLGTLDRPDRMVLDLDPDPALPWERVVEAAHLARSLLRESGLESFPKTSGGRGLHVVVPLARRHEWDEVKRFARAVAEYLAHVLPGQYTASAGRAERLGRIYVDHLRNARGATIVAAFSARARPGALISMPLAWDEVAANLPPETFTISSALALVRARPDPWTQFWDLHQSLPADTGGLLTTGTA
jgi:bifunctional non-homologous end joining protein LigD